jgi:hypothetical protein
LIYLAKTCSTAFDAVLSVNFEPHTSALLPPTPFNSMSSTHQDRADVPKATPTTSSAYAIGTKKIKVVPGSHIKTMAAVLDSATKVTTTPTQSPTTSKAAGVTSDLAVPATKTNTEAHKDDKGHVASAAALTDPVSASPKLDAAVPQATPTEEERGDFDVFPAEHNQSLEPEKQDAKALKPHEASVRRLQTAGRKLAVPAATFKPRPAPSVPARATSAARDTTSKDRQVGPPDFEKCLSLERMKDDALSTLKQRRASLRAAHNRIVDAREATTDPKVLEPLKEALDILKNSAGRTER